MEWFKGGGFVSVENACKGEKCSSKPAVALCSALALSQSVMNPNIFISCNSFFWVLCK